MNNDNKIKDKNMKILYLFGFILLLFFVFLLTMLSIVMHPRKVPSKYAHNVSKAQRGEIISADGFHLATTTKLYKAEINTRYLDDNKMDLFIKLFSIYSGIDSYIIENKIKNRNRKGKGTLVLSYSISEKEAQYLKDFKSELRRFQIFIERKNSRGISNIQGLDIKESGEKRDYPYGDILTPVLGYPRKNTTTDFTYIRGLKGLERKFNNELSPIQDSLEEGLRDVNSNVILNKRSFIQNMKDGLNLNLTIFSYLQKKIEKMLDEMKIKTKSQQILVAVMDIKTSNIIALASSNRFLPKKIKRSDYPSLNVGVVEYSFEPGSVIKPLTYSILLNHNRITSSTLVNGHHGKFRIGRKVITDEHRFSWLSAENVIVHSSNIGIAQLADKLSSYEFYQGLLDFGLASKSTPDLTSERIGSIPSPRKLKSKIYKATASYGYGLRVNLMQLIRAYSVFNNDGKMLTPRIVDYFTNSSGLKIPIDKIKSIPVIRKSTAHIVKRTLIKTVQQGTGRKTIIKGLEIGGKTGTAHIVEKGQYVNKYNTSFLGFANDKKAKYTIGVVVIQPQSSQFASQTAVPIFKKTVEIMIENGYLKPAI